MPDISLYMRGQIIKLVWPAILEGVGIMLVGVLTTAMVGRLGAVSLSAVGLATLVQMAAAIIFAAAGTGSAAIVARYKGAKKWNQVQEVAGQSILIGLVSGTVLAAAGYWLAPAAVALTGSEPEVIELAGSLLKITFLFTPFFLVMSISNNILRVMGKTKTVFYLSTAINMLTLVVSYMLIFGISVPALGAYGAGWGLAFGYLTGGIIAVAVLSAQEEVRLRFHHVFCYRPDTVAAILQVSVPAAMEQLAMHGGRIVFTFMLAGAGAVQFAAHQIATQVESISFMPGFGFSIAAMALTGQNLGKGLPHRAAQYVAMINKQAILSMTVMSVVFIFFAQELAAFFIDDEEVIRWAVWCVMLAALEQPAIALTYVYSGALRGAGDTKYPFYITTFSIWGFRMPLVYLFIVVWHFPITWAWGITVLDFVVRSFLFWNRFRTNQWKQIQIG